MKGWLGKIAEIDLSTGRVEFLHPDEVLYHRYLGGVGLAAKLLYDSMRPGIDPLSADNVLALMTGPVTGTSFPGVGRVSFCARSPLSGAWGESSMGGYVGQALKGAGYDGLLIKGVSDAPHYLHVTSKDVALRDASHLWGRDTYETESLLKEQHGKHCQVASIGPAGENLIRFAGINHRGSNNAGRCGLGAVLGAKHLKAIVVEGDGKIEVANPKALNELRQMLLATYKDDAWISLLRSGGTAWGMGWAMELNDVPIKNWILESKVWLEQAQRISGQAMEDAGLVVGRETCYRCPIACRRIVHLDNGPLSVPTSAGPEYETLGSLGAMLMIDDVKVLCKANELCNRYGLDTISCGGTIAWAIEAYERGIITKEDTDGLELRWSDGQLLLELIHRIVYRKGIGKLLAVGSRAAARKVGKESEEFAIQVKGLELPMHHPRAMRGIEISYATGPRGASHNEGGSLASQDISLEEKATLIKRSVDRAQVIGSAVFCNFTVGPLSDEAMAGVLKATTGHDYDLDEMYKIGRRIWHMRRAFNLRYCGMDGTDDVLPQRVVSQLPTDTPFDDLLTAYYQARGLDAQGIPLRSTLQELGLEDVADDLKLETASIVNNA